MHNVYFIDLSMKVWKRCLKMPVEKAFSTHGYHSIKTPMYLNIK